MSYTSLNDPMFETIGDHAHMCLVVLTLLFAFGVVKYSGDPKDTFFDEQWKRDGFCVQNADIPYWNSHDACLYFDTVAAIVVFLVYWKFRKTPGMERANEIFSVAAIGILVHGIGHGGIGKRIRDGGDQPLSRRESLEEIPLWESAQNFSLFFLFWAGLLKASAPHLKNAPIALIIAITMAVDYFLIPGKFGFTFVQTVLMMVFSLNQLARKREEKDFMYASHPLLVGIPLVFIGFVESTQCTAFVQEKLYGHLIYDGFIPLATIFWYMICYLQVTSLPDPVTPLIKKDKAV